MNTLGIIPGLIYVDISVPAPRNPLMVFIDRIADELAQLSGHRAPDLTTRIAKALHDDTKALMIHEGVWREFEGQRLDADLRARRARAVACHREAVAMGFMGAAALQTFHVKP